MARRAAAPILVLAQVALLVLAACEAGASPEPVLAPGRSAESDCERAVVARAELARDEGATAAERLEGDVYASCTYDEFVAANDNLADGHRYSGDLRTHVGRRCLRLTSLYRGSRLCETLPSG